MEIMLSFDVLFLMSLKIWNKNAKNLGSEAVIFDYSLIRDHQAITTQPS